MYGFRVRGCRAFRTITEALLIAVGEICFFAQQRADVFQLISHKLEALIIPIVVIIMYPIFLSTGRPAIPLGHSSIPGVTHSACAPQVVISKKELLSLKEGKNTTLSFEILLVRTPNAALLSL